MSVGLIDPTGNNSAVGQEMFSVEREAAVLSVTEEPKDVKVPDLPVLSNLVSDAQKNLDIMHGKNLNFSIHEASGRTMISVTDETTGQIVREIPSKEMLNLAVKLEEMVGLIFDQKA